jgi:uncharacterized protein
MVARSHNIQLPLERIEAFCRRNPIQKLSLFGSVLRDDFTDKSDVDFLVELDPTAHVGLFEFLHMQFELQDMIGRPVDLRTPEDLHERFRQKVVDQAETVYECKN